MKRFDVVGTHTTLSADFINEPCDESRDGHAHFIHVGVVRGTLGIYAVTFSNTTDTDTVSCSAILHIQEHTHVHIHSTSKPHHTTYS